MKSLSGRRRVRRTPFCLSPKVNAETGRPRSPRLTRPSRCVSSGSPFRGRTLVFRSKRGGPLLETTILSQCLHPALNAWGLPKSGFHVFCRGCNRRWELAGLNHAVRRQMMGHSSATMTRMYTGEIPLQDDSGVGFQYVWQ
jgi:integrase